MFNGMTSYRLIAILSAVEPVDLKGLALLRRRRPRPGHWLPTGVSSRALAEASTQMIAYMQSCERAAKHLEALRPVPQAASVEEWPL